MKKATGKVVSLVLALALVITSFSATFAFAATESGKVYMDTAATVYLSNTNGLTASDLDQSNPEEGAKKLAAMQQVNLTDLLKNDIESVGLESSDHFGVEFEEIAQVSVSGDNILRVSRDPDTKDYILTVRSSTGTGTATVNVLFRATLNRPDEDDEVTIRGSKSITFVLLDRKTPILTSDGSGVAGDKLTSGLDNLPKNGNKKTHGKDTVYEVSGTAAVYLPYPSGDARANYIQQNLISVDALEKDNKNVTADYAVEVSGSKLCEETTYAPVNGQTITYIVDDPTVGSSVRVTVYSIKESKDSNDVAVYSTDRIVARETARVENWIDGSVTEIAKGSGDSATVNGVADKTLTKSKTYALIDDEYWDATGARVTSKVAVTVVDGRVGDVKSTTSTVTVEAGDVGAVSAKTDVVLGGGTVASADGDNVRLEGATVSGSVSANDTFTVSSGRVTGEVKAATVDATPLNSEENITLGDVTANEVIVNASEGNVAISSIIADGNIENAGGNYNWDVPYPKSGERSASITLSGDKLSVGSIDFARWIVSLNLNNFKGEIPAPVNAQAAGSSINSNDDENEDIRTDVTVRGNLSIDTIALEGGEVYFNGRVSVANLLGGEATLVINAGNLYVTESVSTSNVLKLAQTASVAPGTLVYTAASEIADEDSVIGYGFTTARRSSSSVDAFVINEVSFTGLSILDNTGAAVNSADILLGTSATFTATAYPNGTQIPEGTSVRFYLDADENYIYGEDLGKNTARIDALKYDSTFNVLNQGTLRAVLVDEYDIELEEYGEATVDINVIEKPATTYVSDTTSDVVVPVGNTYQFKITSTNGAVPNFAVAGNNAIFRVVEQNRTGNDYFFKVQAVGTPGQTVGVYINYEGTPVATLTVGANFTCDTTTVNVAAGASYIAKVTANEQPVVAAGNSSYTVELASQSGNDYFFRITAVSAQAGDQVGFYINSSAAPVFIATTV